MTRLEIATQLAAGLLASQDPDKGWQIARVCEVAFRTADKLIELQDEPLPKEDDASRDS